ncbi:MAG: tail fiber protein [Bacteroidota bacterium]
MSFLSSLRSRLADRIAPEAPGSRRDFFRYAAGTGAAALGAGLMLPDDAWAGVEERAAHFGITPGTVVDAQGRPMRSQRGIMEPFIGTICSFGFQFAPRGWALCDGQLLPINSNQALFSLLGTTYGGDGRTTFALPDLRGRAALHQGSGAGLSTYRMGQRGGAETVTLNAAQVPPHNHAVPGALVPRTGFSNVGNEGESNVLASHTPRTSQNLEMTANAGGGQSHENRPPFLTVSFCIALVGIFPSRS